MNTIFKFIVILLFTHTYLIADEKLSKLNSLYLQGIIDDQNYFDSLNGIGIDTSTTIFLDVFDLFKSNTLSIDAYEQTLRKLVSNSLINNQKQSKESLNNNSQNDFVNNTSTFKISKCVGDLEICHDLKNLNDLKFIFNNDTISLEDDLKKEILSDPIMVAIAREKTNLSGKKATYILSLNHAQGMLINFNFKGSIEYNSKFLAERFEINTSGGQVVASATLQEIL